MKITLNGHPVTAAELKKILNEFEDDGCFQKLISSAQELLLERPKCTVTYMLHIGFLIFENENNIND